MAGTSPTVVVQAQGGAVEGPGPQHQLEGVASQSAWLGPVDRFELVKSLLRHGAKSDASIDAPTRLLEEADELAADGKLDQAAAAYERVLAMPRLGSLALARYRLALCQAGQLTFTPAAQPTALGDVLKNLKAAVEAEPEHQDLKAAVDNLLRLLAGVAVPPAAWDDLPRSPGDVRCLAAAALRVGAVREQSGRSQGDGARAE